MSSNIPMVDGELSRVETDQYTVMVAKAPGEKCPRCWMYRYTMNFDNLCNKCVAVILKDHPDHPSVPYILADLKQRGLTKEDNPEWNSKSVR